MNPLFIFSIILFLLVDIVTFPYILSWGGHLAILILEAFSLWVFSRFDNPVDLSFDLVPRYRPDGTPFEDD